MSAPSVIRAAAILDCISEAPERELTGTELGRRLEIAKSSIFNICSAMVEAGLLERDGTKFRIGPKTVKFALAYLAQHDFITEFDRVCDELEGEVQDTVQLAVLNESLEIVYVGIHRGRRYVTLRSDVGAVLPAHCTAMGKALMARLPTDELEQRLERAGDLVALTDHSITDHNDLKKELQLVRQDGFAFDRDETMEGLSCIATTVRVNERRDGWAAVSISFLSDRTNKSDYQRIQQQLTTIATTLEARLQLVRSV